MLQAISRPRWQDHRHVARDGHLRVALPPRGCPCLGPQDQRGPCRSRELQGDLGASRLIAWSWYSFVWCLTTVLYCSETAGKVEFVDDVFIPFVVGGELDVNPLLFFPDTACYASGDAPH